MKRREVIATLIEMSNEMDAIGLFDEADMLTRVAQSFGTLNPTDPEYNPDNSASEHGFLGELDEMERAKNELSNEDALMALDARIEELKNNPFPSEDDLKELEALLDHRMSPLFNPDEVNFSPKNDTSRFLKELQDAGADIVNQDDPFRNE